MNNKLIVVIKWNNKRIKKMAGKLKNEKEFTKGGKKNKEQMDQI